MYRAHADLHEGKLTDLRKSLVNAVALAELAEELGVGECLLLGRGEEQGAGRTKTSILSDALEAVFGAIYLDSDALSAYQVLTSLIEPRLQGAIDGLDRLDAKTRLQEMASKLLGEQVHYKIDDEGPDHDKTFYATVFVGERELGSGEGRSKKAAEQLAAEIACDTSRANTPTTDRAGAARGRNGAARDRPRRTEPSHHARRSRSRAHGAPHES